MDINQARTFLEIARSGSFIAAAENLHITQTAVSARIRAIEELLGCRLFVRNKAGARLTHAGEKLVRHAASMLQIWERARQQVALPHGRSAAIAIGGEFSLWHPLVADWLIWMRRECPEVALRAEVGTPASLLAHIEDGTLDLAVLYNLSSRLGLVAEPLREEKLVLVTTSPDGRLAPEDYVYVDWGPAFAIRHEAAFPDLGNPPVSLSPGLLALTYVLSVGGCGYFRLGMVQPFLKDQRLWRVPDAPEFTQSVFAVHAERSDAEVIDRALQGLEQLAATRERANLPGSIGPRSRR